ncbi:reverse transcriptase-like protein [Elysia marginata]|uniref:Reverse transcriptase-like protein n=1 Tax=Elysia marginata TaxID=1093978 RepID=A0AAV4JN01_9GAST|nr:reverse transcriptase-like protein [Elysia marginata]
MSALEQFNFGPRFQKYIKAILTNTQSTIKNGGWFSNIFKTERGIRQGCVVSPLLFILVVELLAIKLRHNNKIKGMLEEDSIRGSIKVLQYADDMSLLLKNDDSLGHALKDIEEFTGISGLKLNINKSIGMRVGSSKNNPPGDQGIKWINNNENIKILGIYFNASQESSTIEENWKQQVEKIKILIKRWSKRDLSLYETVHRIHENEPLVGPSHLDETQHNLPTQVNVDSPILYGQWVLRLNSFYDGTFHPSKCFNLTISWKRPPIF